MVGNANRVFVESLEPMVPHRKLSEARMAKPTMPATGHIKAKVSRTKVK